MGSRDWKLGALNRTQKQIQGLSQPGAGGVPALKDNSGLIEMVRQKQEADAQKKAAEARIASVEGVLSKGTTVHGGAQIQALQNEYNAAVAAGDMARAEGVQKALQAIITNDGTFGSTLVDSTQDEIDAAGLTGTYLSASSVPDYTGGNKELVTSVLSDDTYKWFQELMKDD